MDNFKKGDIVHVHCCDNCTRRHGITPKCPPESRTESWYCEICGHHGIGSIMSCEVSDWLALKPLQSSI